MVEILLLAVGAAVFPALLACVTLLLARPKPRPLLIAFYLGGLSTSLVCGVAVIALFDQGESVVGSTSSAPHPAVSIVEGVVALALACLMVSRRARAPISRWRAEHPRRHSQRDKHDGPSWIERQLDRASPRITFLVGAFMNLPGPFYLLALGRIARDDYGTVQEIVLIVVFNMIMFVLLEVPLVGYVVAPQSTAERVTALGRWLNVNGLRVMGGLVGLFAISLLVQGIVGLAG